MALVRRINSFNGFVLNTLYCKCVTNVKRFVTEHNVMRYSDQVDANKSEYYTSFDEMLQFRQQEAKRCILVKVPNMNCISDLEHFCRKSGTVLNIFPYLTSNHKNFVLIELSSTHDVARLRNVAAFKAGAVCVSPLFSYEPRYKLNVSNSARDITEYSEFVAPKLNKLVNLLKQANSVSDQMMSLYNSLKITDLDIRLRFYTAEQISCYFSTLFPNMHVVPFGSSVNGFGQIGCDLDLLCKAIMDHERVSSRKFFSIAQNIPLGERNEQIEFLKVVSTIMNMCIPGISNIKQILEARVPIIRFVNLHTNMKCDLSSTNTVALHMSELLYIYGHLDWRIKPLVFTIRKWARDMNLTKIYPGQWISNFSLTLLIIFYLQTKNILPSLNTINSFIEISKSNNKRSGASFNFLVDWKKSIQHTNDESLQKLLCNFFEFYSIFDFKTQAICIKNGKFKSKNDFSPLLIHNPFNAALNVSKNVTSNEVIRLVDNFQKAFNTMLNSAEEDIIFKLLNLERKKTKINYESNNRQTQMRLKEKLIPTTTNIDDLKEIQGNIIK